jgi:hypothetical protein
MWAKCKGNPLLPAFLTILLCLSTSTAQQPPIAIENADLWGHYTRPLKMIHSPDGEARRFWSRRGLGGHCVRGRQRRVGTSY